MSVFLFFSFLSFVGLICCWLQITAAKRCSLSTPCSGEGETLPRFFCPPVSVLKPLKGIDDNLFDNLSSFCVQDYPSYELIFALQDHNDPAYKVARKVKEKYKDRNISIIVGQREDGLNPKVNNLIPAYKAAAYDYILISDSNVLADRDYLKETVACMSDPSVGLVTNIIKGVRGRTLASIFENLHMNSFVIGSVCFLDKFLGMPCVIGKSMLMKKDVLESIGGLQAFKNVLAEDFIIGRKISEAGWKVALSGHAVENVNEYWGLGRFLNRHTRWGKLRWKIGGVKYLSELLVNPVFLSALPVLLWEASALTVLFSLCVSAAKAAGDYHLAKNTGTDMSPLLYLLVPLKDIIIGVVWFVPLFSNTVVWRGNRYAIGKDSVISPYPDTGFWVLRDRLFSSLRINNA
ncbi:MAG: glycosyltransferase [Nitrospirae bacterium]|nr:MAG: glycosyltransferase [Nitrospirota bacterium]